MAADLSALEAQVAETIGVQQSAIVLLEGITARLDQLIAEAEAGRIDVAKIEELNAALKTGTDALSAAVEAVPPPVL